MRAGSGRGAGGAAPKGRGRFWKIFFTKVAVGGPLRARPLRGAAPKGKASAVFEGQAVFFTKAAAGAPLRARGDAPAKLGLRCMDSGQNAPCHLCE